ncbi:MAG: SDR family NAD(P)-dependent oxidoreductase [Chloroflexi bacterium]|nr:SDR family NAD(P)-dependent oxidoreductase [Chloroflexota bacterium]
MTNPKRVLITGATGFVGANLARRLLSDGHHVHAIARPGYRPWRIQAIRGDLRLHVIDMGDEAAVNHCVAAVRPEWVFHLAVHGAYSSQQAIRTMVQTNIVATINLVEACVQTGVSVIVNTGSSSEYGFKDHAPTEDEAIDPNSYYAVTKSAATHYCRYMAQTHNLPIPTLRLYSVYGPYEEPTRLMPTLIRRGLNGELPPLVNPDVARDYVYTDDVNDAYLLAATQPHPDPGAVYNVGSGVQTTLREVVEVARDVMHISAEPDWGSMANRSWDTSVWVANNAHIKATLGWQPRYTFADGFRAMVDWLRAHRDLYRVEGESR